MTKPLNLRTIRKQRARDAERRLAQENSVKHGRSLAERKLTTARSVKSEAALDGHKLEK